MADEIEGHTRAAKDLMSVVGEQCAAMLRGATRLVVVTGAGMSRESGLSTFRDALTGLWARFDPEELATEAAFRRNPSRVFGWYVSRLRQIQAAEPHAGHYAIARLATALARLDVVTQNVDGLHRRAGSTHVLELHGVLDAFRCLDAGHPFDARQLEGVEVDDDGRLEPPCCAECRSPIRPGVVWFGEALPNDVATAAWDAARDCDALLVVGTSAMVYPAAELPDVALARGCTVIEINPEVTAFSSRATLRWRAPAGTALPELADRLVATGVTTS